MKDPYPSADFPGESPRVFRCITHSPLRVLSLSPPRGQDYCPSVCPHANKLPASPSPEYPRKFCMLSLLRTYPWLCTLAILRGPHEMSRIKPGLAACMASALPIVISLRPTPHLIFTLNSAFRENLLVASGPKILSQGPGL